MMKNSELGAVAYLAQSVYGKYGNPNYEGANKEIYINNSKDYYTGRSYGATNTSTVSTPDGTYKYDDTPTSGGAKVNYTGTGASTTGTIYGIYDMSGGASEYVMGNYNDGTQQVTGDSGFGTSTNPWPNEMYFDKYTTATPFKSKDKTTNGGSLAETASWYRDSTSSFSTSNSWLIRGGHCSDSSLAGPFYGFTYNGNSRSGSSFRVSFASTS